MNILPNLPYFTKQNLTLFLNKKPETTNYFIKQALKKEELIALKKGFFVAASYLETGIKDLTEKERYLEYLSNILREPSYVSLEYVLSKTGLIPEGVVMITAVSTKTARLFSSKLIDFSYRQINPKLFFGYNFVEFKDKQVKIAGLSKALFDFLYFRKFANVADMRDYLFSRGRFNWEVFTDSDKQKFNEFAKKSKSKKMEVIAKQINRAFL